MLKLSEPSGRNNELTRKPKAAGEREIWIGTRNYKKKSSSTYVRPTNTTLKTS